MKEARIILPTEFVSSKAINACMTLIEKEFRGCTFYNGMGWWHNTSEAIRIVDIAYEPSDENDAKLFDIAWKFREDAKQQSVYLRYGNGHVQMVTELCCMDNGHGHFDLSFGGMLDAMNELTDPGRTTEERVAAFEYLESSITNRGKAA